MFNHQPRVLFLLLLLTIITFPFLTSAQTTNQTLIDSLYQQVLLLKAKLVALVPRFTQLVVTSKHGPQLYIGIDPKNNAINALETVATNSSNVGELRTLVLIANSSATQAQASNFVFVKLNNFIKEVSYGKAWLAGNVFGPYTIPYS